MLVCPKLKRGGESALTDPTDTSDTVFAEIGVKKGNYRNYTQSSEPLVTRINTGYYRQSVGFITTCEKWVGKNPFFGTRFNRSDPL
jgi:hypothetical protein